MPRIPGRAIRFLFAPALTTLLIASSGEADPAEENPRSWGFGWDRGIAARYRSATGWGMGLRLSPAVNDRNSDGAYSWEETTEANSRDALEFHGLTVGLLVFREKSVGRWVRMGPYAELSFDYRRTERIGESIFDDESSFSTSDDQMRTWSLEAGFRPSFVIEDRFVLETRLGIGVSRSFEEDTDGWGTDGVVEDTRHEEADQWRFRFLGQNLGFGTALQFIFYP